MYGWILSAAISALAFGFGDFTFVRGGQRGINVYILYMLFSILAGIASVILLVAMPTSIPQIAAFRLEEWGIVIAVSVLYYAAYMSHFYALTQAPNAGLANALIMLHVIILAFLSYYVLKQPLNWLAGLGVILVFVGSVLITVYSTT